ALRAHDDLVLGPLEVVHLDQALVAARGKQGRFVHEVREVRSRESWAAAGDDVGAHIGGHRNLAHVHIEDLFTTPDVGQRHHDLTVEAAGAHQGGVEDVGPVGGGNHDHAGVAL